MLVFFSPAARRQEEESVRTFYVGEVALTETKLTQMIHTCVFFFARTFPSTPCIFSSAVHRIKTSILSFLADLSWCWCYDAPLSHAGLSPLSVDGEVWPFFCEAGKHRKCCKHQLAAVECARTQRRRSHRLRIMKSVTLAALNDVWNTNIKVNVERECCGKVHFFWEQQSKVLCLQSTIVSQGLL